MNALSPDDDLDLREVEFQRGRLSRFDPRTLFRLAALPEWTEELAATAGFEFQPLADLLTATGLTEQREVLTPDGAVTSTLWLRTSKRPEVGRYLRELFAPSEMEALVHDLADVLGSEPRMWIAAVRGHLSSPAGSRLIGEVDDLLTSGLATEALGLVGAAQALGDLLGEPLLSSARRAQWRIDRSYREALDTRALAHYLPRPEVEAALTSLVHAESWAVHLLGDGGVGKTMAVRDLASGRFAARHRLAPFAVARVDFDHLDPRYPHRRPGELLLALAAELIGYTSTRTAHQSRRLAIDGIEEVHELMSDLGGDRPLDSAVLDSAVESFAAYLDDLGGPVVLVLDTCEELAKLYGPGGRATAVDHTFDVLERIHARTPTMRALLAGRRWLTPPPDPNRSGGLRLMRRPYLRVVPVGGFTHQQAHDYLDLRDPDGIVPTALRDAVLDQAARPGDDDVNPFDLANYCEWALEEPGMNAERLRTEVGDPYVRQRVIDRVTNTSVRDCLPAAVELGRFDLPMIEPYLVRRNIEPDAAFSGLVGQEWVSTVHFDADGRPKVVEVDDQLLPRLRAVLAADPVRFSIDRHRLGRDLAELVTTAEVEDLIVEAVEDALRLLPLAEAATLWSRFEERITDADAWGWASQAVPRAAAIEAARGSGPTILAAILATQAASISRLPGQPGLAELWREVVRLAPRHPEPGQAEALAFRGLCGQVAAGAPLDSAVRRRATELWHGLPPRLRVGPMISMIDAVTAGEVPLPTELFAVLDSLCDADEPEVAITALLARASDRLRRTGPHAAGLDVGAALRIATRAPTRRWTDWAPPTRLVDRVRLARVIIALLLGEPMSRQYDAWREEALAHLADIDAERLVAATISHELCWRLVDRDVLGRVTAREFYLPQRQPTQHWHRRTTTLCVAVSLGLAATEEWEKAVAALQQRRKLAVSSGEDIATTAECDQALVVLCRVLRSTELTKSLHRLTRTGTPETREQAWAALALVEAESPATPEDAGGWRAWWRAQVVVKWNYQASQSYPPVLGPVTETDRAEYELVDRGSLAPQTKILLTRDLDTFLSLDSLFNRGSAEWVGELMRIEALLGHRQDRVDAFIETQPPRRTAEIALAEGELLALRLPEQAVLLLERATALFKRCGDERSAHRASVLHVLTTARAGGDPTSVALFPAPAALPGGWSAETERAEQLVSGGIPSVHSPTVHDAVVYGDVVQAGRIGSVVVGPNLAGPPTEDAPTDSDESYRSGFVVTLYALAVAAVAAVPIMLRVPVLVVIAISVLVLVLGIGVVVAIRGGRARRPSRTAQLSVAFDLEGTGWSACSIDPASNGDFLVVRSRHVPVDIGDQRWPSLQELPAELFATRRPYVVVPLRVTDKGLDEQWEQRLGARTAHLGGKVPLWVRFRTPASVNGRIDWTLNQVWGSDKQLDPGSRYSGPSGIRPNWSELPFANTAHLVGTPVRTSAGWRMRVEAEGEASSSGPYMTTGRGTFTGENLLGPDDLPFGLTSLVVLQADLVDGPPRPLHRLRTGMFGLAREFGDTGVAVLVVPPLPDDLAARVVSRVAEVSSGSDFTPMRVLDLFHEIRSVVAARETESSENGERPSLDVVLIV